MVTLVALVVWRLPLYVVFPCFLIFAAFDGVYLSSAATKVPHGAWFTLCLAAILSSIFVLWRFGKEVQWHAEASDRISPWNLISEMPNANEPHRAPELCLSPPLGGGHVSRLRGVGIFFDKTGSANGTPAVFVHFLQKFQAAPAQVIFLHLRPLSCPTVAPEDRFSISGCSTGPGSVGTLQGFYRVTIRHGYADRIITNDLGLLVYENIRNFIIHEGRRNGNSSSSSSSNDNENPPTKDDEPAGPVNETDNTTLLLAQQTLVHQRLNALLAAYEEQVVHIVGKEQMRIGTVHDCQGWVRRIALAAFLWLRSNTGSKVANLDLEVAKLVEVGFVKVI